MNQSLYAGLDPATRLSHLEADACKVVADESYDRPLEDSELEARKNQTHSILDRQDELAAEKKLAMDQFKGKATELGNELRTIRSELRTGTTRTKGTLYYVPDYEARKMEIYNGDGYLVHSRGLLPEERQQNMFVRRASND